MNILKRIWQRAISNNRQAITTHPAVAVSPEVLNVLQKWSGEEPPQKWELVHFSRQISPEECEAQNLPKVSGIMRSWSEPVPNFSFTQGGRMVQPMRHRWDATERRIYVERML